MSKLSLIHSTQKAGPNTEIYGPRSEYGCLRTACRPIRMQDSSKPYNNKQYVTIMERCIKSMSKIKNFIWFGYSRIVDKNIFCNFRRGIEIDAAVEIYESVLAI